MNKILRSFDIYILLKTLGYDDEILKQVSKTEKYDNSLYQKLLYEALKFYKFYTESLEIVFHGELILVYF